MIRNSYFSLSLWITKERVATAFLHSLSTKKVHLRSALSSWALTSSLPFHTYEERPVVLPNYSSCGDCNFNKLMSNKEYVNEDLNVLNLAIFHKMLEAVQDCDAQNGAQQLEKRWKGVFPSSKNERDVVMEVWGYGGMPGCWSHRTRLVDVGTGIMILIQ